MQPNKSNVIHFIYKATQYFQIPDFQRPYTWNAAIVDSFLQDLEHVRATSRNHYFGTVVYVPEADHFTVIDGQQRLTTTLLMLVAIYHILREHPEKSSLTPEQIKNQYLYDQYGAPDKDRKILLRTVTTDNEVFKKLFEGQSLSPDEAANRQKKTYEQFRRYFLQRDHLESYINALRKFEIITVAIDANDDNPQLIFESINSTGAPLSNGDKIRNYSLMLNSEGARRHVYDQYWSKIEKTLTRRDGNEQVDDITGFYRHFLQCKKGENFPEVETYSRFKTFFDKSVGSEHSINRLDAYYEDLLAFLEAYCFVRYAEDPHRRFYVFEEYNFRFQYLDFAARTSFLMDALVGYIRNECTRQEVLGIYKTLEIFIARRLMCNMGVAGMNNMLPTWFKQIGQLRERYAGHALDDIFRYFILEGRGRTRVFPNDSEVRNAIENYPVGTYANRHQNYFLACIEDSIQPNESRMLSQIRKGEIKLSVEHIMPQTLSPAWKHVLGDNAETIHETWLNRLANLTLTGYNSTYSNKPFAEKKDCENGFANSTLNINRHIAEYADWNEETLKLREKWLADRILRAWPTLVSDISPDGAGRIGRRAIGEDIDLSGSNITCVTVLGNEFPVRSWTEFMEIICKQLFQLDPDLFASLLDDGNFVKSSGRRLVSNVQGRNRSLEVTPGLYIDVVWSASDMRVWATKLAHKFGLEGEIFYDVAG
jgi:hypothetical protein